MLGVINGDIILKSKYFSKGFIGLELWVWGQIVISADMYRTRVADNTGYGYRI